MYHTVCRLVVALLNNESGFSLAMFSNFCVRVKFREQIICSILTYS